MPTLQFKGKNIVWNHHLSIPYHTLDEVEKLHFQPEKANGNLIIEGDNLLTLKALLPQYAGKVKCISIDPPYNTGNGEGGSWVYSDNMNNPMIREWLGKEVSKDDLTRHDKWLCMMAPRLKLLRELLSDDGVIFISIDDNEVYHLRMLLNEIFNEENFISELAVIRSEGGGLAKQVVKGHDYLLVFAKDINKFIPLKRAKDIRGKIVSIENVEYWIEEDWLRKEFGKYGTCPYDEIEKWHGAGKKKEIDEGLKKGIYTLIPKKDGIKIVGRYRKIEEDGSKFYSVLKYLNADGVNLLKELRVDFPFPKPLELIREIISGATFFKKDKNAIILDSFAGSGTTMHAVMDLNKEDGGNRKCIMIQMTEATEADPNKNICKDITRERVKRAIGKYGYDSGFQYFKVGIPIDAETLLSGKLPTFNQFAEYVYYLCTGESLKNKAAVHEKSYFVGEHGNSVIYLVYKQDFDELTRMALNLSLAEKIIAEHPKKKIIVYAPACFLEEDYMKEKNIDYVGIPYNLFRRVGE